MAIDLREVTGYRGEKLVELCLTNYASFDKPLFRPGFLGDKWPAIDFYVELIAVKGRRPYFFGQVKSTRATLLPTATELPISTKKKDIKRLLQIPGPTYIFGVHEPSSRVFIRSVHNGTPPKAITKISLSYELTNHNLQKLQDEVKAYWSTRTHKPITSVFS